MIPFPCGVGKPWRSMLFPTIMEVDLWGHFKTVVLENPVHFRDIWKEGHALETRKISLPISGTGIHWVGCTEKATSSTPEHFAQIWSENSYASYFVDRNIVLDNFSGLPPRRRGGNKKKERLSFGGENAKWSFQKAQSPGCQGRHTRQVRKAPAS